FMQAVAERLAECDENGAVRLVTALKPTASTVTDALMVIAALAAAARRRALRVPPDGFVQSAFPEGQVEPMYRLTAQMVTCLANRDEETALALLAVALPPGESSAEQWGSVLGHLLHHAHYAMHLVGGTQGHAGWSTG